MVELFSGPLLPLIGKTIPDLSESFEQFAQGLKKRAEGTPLGQSNDKHLRQDAVSRLHLFDHVEMVPPRSDG